MFSNWWVLMTKEDSSTRTMRPAREEQRLDKNASTRTPRREHPDENTLSRERTVENFPTTFFFTAGAQSRAWPASAEAWDDDDYDAVVARGDARGSEAACWVSPPSRCLWSCAPARWCTCLPCTSGSTQTHAPKTANKDKIINRLICRVSPHIIWSCL